MSNYTPWEIGIIILASVLIWLMFLGVLILWIIDGKVKKELALHTFFSIITAWIASEIIKSFLPIPRPFQVNGREYLTLITQASSSFPSGHSAVAFALATNIWLHNKKTGAIFMLAAVGVASGRVLSNVHYPQDVLAGAILGVGVGYGIRKIHPYSLLSKFKNNG